MAKTTVNSTKTTTTTKQGTPPEVTQASETVDQTTESPDALPELETYFKIWAKAVDTQMHFNEMSAKSRQLGLTFVVAALGLAVVLIGQGKDYALPIREGFEIHAGVLVILSAAVALVMVRTLDLGVYHRMLRGAVAFGEELEEKRLRPTLGTEKGMTQAISYFSRHGDAKFTLAPAAGVAKFTAPTKLKTAEQKIRRFYFWSIALLLLVAGSILAVTYKPKTNRPGSDPEKPSVVVNCPPAHS